MQYKYIPIILITYLAVFNLIGCTSQYHGDLIRFHRKVASVTFTEHPANPKCTMIGPIEGLLDEPHPFYGRTQAQRIDDMWENLVEESITMGANYVKLNRYSLPSANQSVPLGPIQGTAYYCP